MKSYQDTVLSKNALGQLSASVGLSVQVNLAGTATPAVLYSDNIGTTLANPLTTNVNGGFKFYAINGRYDLVISGALITTYTIADTLITDGASASGTTGQRPANPTVGQEYLDTDLGFMIMCLSISPVVWINTAGAVV
jgi:hypothetical protein